MTTQELTGPAASIKALLAAERRLGVTFPDAYRAFIADRKRYDVVKRISFYPIARCDWADDGRTAIAIGRSMVGDGGTLVFKVKRGVVSDAVYEVNEDGPKRIPDFNELVRRKHESPTLHTDERVRLAERLGGAARQCTCKREIRVLQVCECGRIGARTDKPYVLTEAELAHAEQAFGSVVRAWRVITSLKAAGHVVPSGPKQLIATADLLEAGATPAAVLAAWQETGMKVDVSKALLARVLKTS